MRGRRGAGFYHPGAAGNTPGVPGPRPVVRVRTRHAPSHQLQRLQKRPQTFIVPRRAPQIVDAEPSFQIVGRRRLAVARPELLQVVLHISRRRLSCFLPLMQAQDQPFEIRFEKNEFDPCSCGDRRRVASFSPIFRKPVGVQENETPVVRLVLSECLGAVLCDTRTVSRRPRRSPDEGDDPRRRRGVATRPRTRVRFPPRCRRRCAAASVSADRPSSPGQPKVGIPPSAPLR